MSTLKTTNIAHPSSASNNIVLDSSGNVVLQAGTAAAPALQPTGDTNTGVLFPAADTVAISTGGSERARVNSSGYVGIGTTSPGANLEIGTSSGSNTSIKLNSSTDDYLEFSSEATIGYIIAGNSAGGTGSIGFKTADAAPPTEAARITRTGELLVGYTTDNGAYKLQVNSQIFATSATIATSDGRYKENVTTLDGCVDLVKALRPVSFDWKPQQDITRIDDEGNEVLVREGHNFPNGTQVGFIAQEVHEVLADKPWLGSVIKQNVRPAVKDAEGNELAPEEDFLGIAEGNLIAVLTSALQETIGRIEALEAEVAALKAS